jgi:hypothetical protein
MSLSSVMMANRPSRAIAQVLSRDRNLPQKAVHDNFFIEIY